LELEPIGSFREEVYGSGGGRCGQQGRLVESFAVGTAYFVAAIEGMNLRGEDIAVLLERWESTVG